VDPDECTITCEWHGAMFDLRTGVPQCPPAVRPVPVFTTRVENDSVFVDMPE
jgi:3-phenylpropionate/trans-cinnamate dioxygenase ferredoxin subunit